MNWLKVARTFRVNPEEDHTETGEAEGLFNRTKIRYGRQKDISHVAEEDGKIIGAVASGWSEEDRGEPVMVFSFDLAVDPEFRRRGVGKKLIEDAIREYERGKTEYRVDFGDRTMMRIWVINPHLIPYLESIGFEIESEYNDGSAHLIKY